MPDSWTTEQVIALAPDTSSAKAGQGLATPRKWLNLGRSEMAVWGECQGSGKDPYQTQIDLSEPAFRCSCPSRKFPCKHGLGLFLILAGQPTALVEGEPPGWVSDWLASRTQRAEKKAQAAAEKAERGDAVADAAAQAKRAASRRERVTAGLQELELWLRDLTRGGLAHVQTQPYSFWETPASRLVDAQAPGVARLVREMGSLPAGGAGWEDRLLQRLGRLSLLLEAFKRLDDLPPEVQEDVRSVIGWTRSQEELLASEGVRDRWAVLGQRVEDEERVRVQRTWLEGAATGRFALVLSFAAFGQALDTSLVPGTRFEGELVFYPGACPLRAVVKNRLGPPSPVGPVDGAASLREALGGPATALAANPWLVQYPLAVGGVRPALSGSERGANWHLRDYEDRALPLSPRFNQGWQLLALSGGEPLGVFGEWDGRHLLPLAAWTQHHYFNFRFPGGDRAG